MIYWGNSDDRLNLPSRTSLSMTLQGTDRALDYTATIKTLPPGAADGERDIVIIDGREDKGQIYSGIVKHLDAMREMCGFKERLAVSTRTTFPIGSGLAGSAAAHSALAEAFAGLVADENNDNDIHLDREKISMMARRGSGSAARSVFGGFVKLLSRASGEPGMAVQLFDEDHWDLRDVIAVVDPGLKKTNSRDGMRLSTRTCPAEIYSRFVAAADTNVSGAQEAIAGRDLQALGRVYESDNALFRKVCMNTEPALDYWSQSTAEVFDTVAKLRADGMAVFAGTDAGPNVHVFCVPRESSKLVEALRGTPGVREIIHARPGGPSKRTEEQHLL